MYAIPFDLCIALMDHLYFKLLLTHLWSPYKAGCGGACRTGGGGTAYSPSVCSAWVEVVPVFWCLACLNSSAKLSTILSNLSNLSSDWSRPIGGLPLLMMLGVCRMWLLEQNEQMSLYASEHDHADVTNAHAEMMHTLSSSKQHDAILTSLKGKCYAL